jgi:quercetin dioxygenase-like cupin family protein
MIPAKKRRFVMRRKSSCLILMSAVIVVLALYVRKLAATPATPPPGFTSTTLAKGLFGGIDVFNQYVQPNANVWLSLQKTKGDSDVYVQANTWQPEASTGWHTHPGHSLVTVTAGTVTVYEGDDPDCKPHVYTAGMGFVDPVSGGHVHIVRNEGTVAASAIAVQVIPSGQPRRIDAPDPGNCHF